MPPHFAKLSPNPQPQLGDEEVIVPINNTTHPPNHLASSNIIVRQKDVCLVQLDSLHLLNPFPTQKGPFKPKKA